MSSMLINVKGVLMYISSILNEIVDGFLILSIFLQTSDLHKGL